MVSPRIVKTKNSPVIIEGFEQMGFLNCTSATNGMHISVLCLPFLASKYINRKRLYSLFKQVLVDLHGIFMNIYIVYTGRGHDASMLWRSGLFQCEQAGVVFFPNKSAVISGVSGPAIIVSDPVTTLPWMMKCANRTRDSSSTTC